MLSSGAMMLSSGANVIMWDEILSSGMKCHLVEANAIILPILCCTVPTKNLMLSSRCYHVALLHVMISCGMMTPPSLIIPENLTRSVQGGYFSKMRELMLLKNPAWDFF